MKRSFLWALLIALASIAYAQAQTSITGKATDTKSGEAVPFASVALKGTTIGVNTDIDGNYSISVPATATTLVFSEVGHTEIQVDINGRTVINVAMEPGATQLDEVVVTAYGGIIKKSSLSGAVSTLSNDKLNNQPTLGVDGAIAGKMAGVHVLMVFRLPNPVI